MSVYISVFQDFSQNEELRYMQLMFFELLNNFRISNLMRFLFSHGIKKFPIFDTMNPHYMKYCIERHSLFEVHIMYQ